jgi:hypothetical protein
MNWDKEIVQRKMQGAGDYPGVQLQFLLTHLDQKTESVRTIADAIRDMGGWYLKHAEALCGEVAHRDAKAKLSAIVNTSQK